MCGLKNNNSTWKYCHICKKERALGENEWTLKQIRESSPNRIEFLNQVSMSFGARRQEKIGYHYSCTIHHIDVIMLDAICTDTKFIFDNRHSLWYSVDF